jgi:hypothetical protein
MPPPTKDEVVGWLADPESFKKVRALVKAIKEENEASFRLTMDVVCKIIESKEVTMIHKIHAAKLLKDVF